LGEIDPLVLLGGKTAQMPGSLPPKSRFSSAVILQTELSRSILRRGLISRR